jgi:hypothetical protein
MHGRGLSRVNLTSTVGNETARQCLDELKRYAAQPAVVDHVDFGLTLVRLAFPSLIKLEHRDV